MALQNLLVNHVLLTQLDKAALLSLESLDLLLQVRHGLADVTPTSLKMALQLRDQNRRILSGITDPTPYYVLQPVSTDGTSASDPAPQCSLEGTVTPVVPVGLVGGGSHHSRAAQRAVGKSGDQVPAPRLSDLWLANFEAVLHPVK